VSDLGIGSTHSPVAPTTASLTDALAHALDSGVAGRARSIAAAIRTDGVEVAAQRLMTGNT